VTAGAPKPPPFPVVAPPKTGKTQPPIPHISAPVEPPMPLPPGLGKPKIPLWKNKIVLIGGVAALLALAGGGWFFFLRPEPPPPIPAKPATAAAPKAAPAADLANKPAAATPAPAPAAAGPALSETQAAIAHAPVNAINKAKDVAAKRVGGDQGRDAVNAIMDGDAAAAPAGKAAPKAPAAPAPAQVATSTSIAPGISATNADVGAGAEASPAFRSFVANVKVSGVFQGSPPRIMLNGRLVRGGEVVDGGLNITFDSIDAEKKMLLFKDKSGATVTRRY
jgi:pyruvate/2-oxoglutarate dehydrogenase complex dihydrolipoamide acyltransferase (E2) component